MKGKFRFSIAIAALTFAAAAPIALGAGEPKNELPFTGQMGDVAERYVAGRATNDPAGEPKNQWPFTRTVSRATQASGHANASGANVAGEPKNEGPFVRSISTTPILVRTSDGFDWGDAGIGAAAVLGIGCIALGALAGAHRRPRATSV
ncbi:MAG TPA: hypothetical protein VH760_01380 [Gaiellaceae bacterium]|jgi:hypothetical protein